MVFLAAHPELSQSMLRELARRLRHTNEQMADLVFSGSFPVALPRPSWTWPTVSANVPRKACTSLTTSPRKNWLTLVGASRETVNKSLADFVSRNWIRLEGRAVLLIEIGRLQRRAH